MISSSSSSSSSSPPPFPQFVLAHLVRQVLRTAYGADWF
jgi:hypothetical protein